MSKDVSIEFFRYISYSGINIFNLMVDVGRYPTKGDIKTEFASSSLMEFMPVYRDRENISINYFNFKPTEN